MRQRSITGPIILVLIGVAFLMNNIGGFNFWTFIGDYWPVLLIGIGVAGLAEVLFHTSRGSAPPPRPMGGAGWWIAIAILIATVTSIQRGANVRIFDGEGFKVLGRQRDYPVDVTQSAAGVTRVLIDTPRGDITVHGEESGDLRITGRKQIRAYNSGDADKVNEESKVRLDRQGDLLTIRMDPPTSGGSLSLSADLDIALPRSVSVELRSRTGDVAVQNLQGAVNVNKGRGDVNISGIGNNVRLESSRSGQLRITDVKGNLEVSGKGSEVQLRDVQGETSLSGEYSGTLEFRNMAKQFHFKSQRSDFSAAAIPGTIVLDLGDLRLDNVTGPVRFTTGSRDVQATDVTNSLELNVDRGDISVEQSKAPLPKVDVRSRHGDLTLTIPDNAPFELDGRTGQGDVNNSLGSAVDVKSEGRSSSVRAKQASGGPRITLSTDRGSITLRKR